MLFRSASSNIFYIIIIHLANCNLIVLPKSNFHENFGSKKEIPFVLKVSLLLFRRSDNLFVPATLFGGPAMLVEGFDAMTSRGRVIIFG